MAHAARKEPSKAISRGSLLVQQFHQIPSGVSVLGVGEFPQMRIPRIQKISGYGVNKSITLPLHLLAEVETDSLKQCCHDSGNTQILAQYRYTFILA